MSGNSTGSTPWTSTLPVAQLNRASSFYLEGRGFESYQGVHLNHRRLGEKLWSHDMEEELCRGCGDTMPDTNKCLKCGTAHRAPKDHPFKYQKCKCYKRKWRECTPVEAIAWAQVRTIEAPFEGYTSKELYRYGVRFSDDSVVACESVYEEDISDITPGDGLLPPTWWIGELK